MTTAWAYLPNAKHIDRVLASVKANHELWSAGYDASRRTAHNAAGYDAAFNTARDAAFNTAYDAAYDAWEAAWDAAWDAASSAAWVAARGAVLALIVYVDCAHMLDSDIGELKILAALGDSRAILLLPACIVFAKERALCVDKNSQ